MKNFSDLTRQERIEKVMSLRRQDLAIVLEDLAEERNAAAIIRTAEGFGVGKVYIVQSAHMKTRVSRNVSSGAVKWMEIEYFDSIESCMAKLREEGFKVYGAFVDPNSKQLWEGKFEGKVAIIVGNEPNGMSETAQRLVDENLYIPMYGLTESFNVSVSAAICLYEVIRQKEVQ